MEQIKIHNQHYIKNATDRRLAQIVFTAEIPAEMWNKYIAGTSHDNEKKGRIKFMRLDASRNESEPTARVFGIVSHGFGYGIEQDISSSINR